MTLLVISRTNKFYAFLKHFGRRCLKVLFNCYNLSSVKTVGTVNCFELGITRFGEFGTYAVSHELEVGTRTTIGFIVIYR